MIEVLRTQPGLIGVIGDLVFKMQDSPGAKEIAERLYKMLPPQLQQQDGTGNQQVPPAVKQLIDQQSQVIEQLTQHLHQTMDELEDKKTELASKERQVLYQTRASILNKLADLHAKMGMEALEIELRQVEQLIEQLNQEQPLNPDQPEPPSSPIPAGPPAAPDQAGGIPTGPTPPATGGGMTPGENSMGGIPNA